MTGLLDAAVALAAQGFRVFPLIPNSKKPAVEGFQFVATDDIATVMKWWTERPDCNVGICTTDMVVVDVDVKKGPHAIENFDYALCGDRNTLTVRTPTGGFHFYYSGGDYGNSAEDLAPGIDIRSHNGYVVGPGSVTPEGSYTVVNAAPVAPLPPLIEVGLKPPGPARTRSDDASRDLPHNVELARQYLASAEIAIEGQGGNQTTFRVAAKAVRDYALSPETAYHLLQEQWNGRCIPPWDANELWTLVQNADAYGTSNLGKSTPDVQFGDLKVPDAPTLALPPPQFDPAQVEGVHLDNMIRVDKQVARRWKIRNFALSGEVTLLAGFGSVGKSVFQLTLAAHFAVGRDFGPFKLREQKPQRIFLHNGEDKIDEASRRLFAIAHLHKINIDVMAKNIALSDNRTMPLMFGASQRYANMQARVAASANTFMSKMAEIKPDIIMLDPLVNLHAFDENNNVEMRQLMENFNEAAASLDVAIILAHHMAKGSGLKDKGDADGMRGASAIVNSSRVAVIMSGPSKDDYADYGIKQADRTKYVRVDVGKANLFARSTQAMAWLKLESVQHPSGDLIGVPTIVNFENRKSDFNTNVLDEIVQLILDDNRATIAVSDAAKVLVLKNLVEPTNSARATDDKARRFLERLIGDGIHVDKGHLRIVDDAALRRKCIVLD